MPANNGIITIKFIEGSNKAPGPEAINDKMDGGSGISDKDLFKSAIYTSLLQKAKDQIKGMVVSEAKYQINKYYQLTDNYLGQQNTNIALSVINKVSSLGLSMFAGAKLGSAAGPVGTVIGAMLGTTLSILSVNQQIQHNYEQERIKINQMDVNLQFNRQRAGYSLTSGSIGENR